MRSFNIIIFVIWHYSLSICQSVPTTLDAFRQLEYIQSLEAEDDIAVKKPMAYKSSNMFIEPCGHRLYNPAAIHPLLQKEFEGKFEKYIQVRRSDKAKTRSRATIRIPIVVHVIHQGQPIGSGENISEEQINSQISALNDAFNRTPGTRYATTENNGGYDYNQITENLDIIFELAKLDPAGNPSNGINRKESIKDYHLVTNFVNDIIKPATIWNPDYYLNLWSTRLTDGARPGLLGYAVFPSFSGLEGLSDNSLPNADGIVCDYRTVGSNAYSQQFELNSSYQYGVTTIHEIGHFLGLRHVWGDGLSEDVGCGVDDYVDDTPNAAFRSSSCNAIESCNSFDMNENYMDYATDACKNIFTKGQGERIYTVLENSPRRASLTTSPILNGMSIPDTEKPGNDLCQDAVVITCGQSMIGTTDQSTNTNTFSGLDGRLCSGAAATQGVWFSFSGEGQEVTLVTNGSGTDYDASIHVFSGPCENLVCVGGHDDGSSQFSNSGSDLVFIAEENTSYFIYVSGSQGETGSFNLSIACKNYNSSGAPSNDSYLQPAEITCGASIQGSTDGSSIDAIGSGDCGVDLRDKGVWYEFVGTDELITVSTCSNISFDTKLAIFEGFDSFWGCFAENDNGGSCEKGSTKRFFGRLGKTYLIWVGGRKQGDFTLTLTCEPAPEAPINIIFSKQQQIDSFSIKYPSTVEVLGDIVISHELVDNNTIIHNLKPLAKLETIGGNLIVEGNIWDAFNNLDGLDQLTAIGGDLIIRNNVALKNIRGLKSLKSIGGNVYIQGFSLAGYDGLNNLEEINGDLTLEGGTHRGQINDFEKLNNLLTIGGDLNILRIRTMDTLYGLNSLQSIGGDLLIERNNDILGNEGLKVIAGFDNLASLGGSLKIQENKILQKITGLDNGLSSLLSIDGDLVIRNNDNRGDSGFEIGGFENLNTIGGSLKIHENRRLQKITGFNKLKTIQGDFQFSDILATQILTSITGLQNLDSIYGKYEIRSNNNDRVPGFLDITTIKYIGDSIIIRNIFGAMPVKDFMPALEFVGKSIVFIAVNDVPSIHFFPKLKHVGEDIIIRNFNRALSIRGFTSLESIEGSLIIGFNGFNESINGFNTLQFIGGSLSLNPSSSFLELNAFAQLDSIGQSLNILIPGFNFSIITFPKLVSVSKDLVIGKRNRISKFSAPKLNSIGNDFLIGPDNFSLDSFDLQGLNSIDGSFVFDSSRITKLIGIENLTTIGKDFVPSTNLISFENTNIELIGGDFILDTMRFLRDIDELESLQSVGGDLTITRNPILENLDGFFNLMDVGGDLAIQKNPTLSNCQSICAILNIGEVEGTISISDNLEGCNALEELQCGATRTDLIADEEIIIFPNPLQDNIHIVADGLHIDALELQDLTGKQIRRWDKTFIDRDILRIPQLQPGIYLLKIVDRSNRHFVKKLIKY